MSTDNFHTITAKVIACDTQSNCNAAPATGSVSIGSVPTKTTAPAISPSGTGKVCGQAFTTSNGSWTGSPTSYQYQWLRNTSTAISGATGSGYTSVAADAGTTLTVEVKATNAWGASGWATSSNNAQFAPCNTVAPTVSPSGTSRTVGETLTATNGTWADAISTTYSYTWLRGTTQVGTGSTYTTGAGDVGSCLTVKVTGTNTYGSSSVTSSNSACYVNHNPASPTNLSPVDGAIANNETPTLSSTFTDPDGQSGYVAYTIKTLGGTTVASGQSASVSSGSTASWTVPAGTLSAGTTYVWYAQAVDSMGATSSQLGPFDYIDQYRLGTASDYSFWSQPIDDRESLSVNVGNGNLILAANDLRLAGLAGFDLNLPRTYNSLYAASQDLAGSQPANGWQTVASLGIFSNGDVRYASASGREYTFDKNADGSFAIPADGVDAQLAKNSDGSYTLTFDGSNEKLNFNSSGALQSDVDANGNTISFSWSSGQLASITDSLSHTTSFTYTSGQLTKITDPGGRIYSYGYDSSGRLSSFTDPTNATTSYGYDSSGRLSQVIDPDGNLTQIAYDSSGRVSTVTRGLDSTGNCPVGATCPVTSFLYAQPGGTFCPASSGTETDVTDPKMHTTRYCYDSQLRVTNVMDPLGFTTTTSYTSGGSNCADNQPCSSTDANNVSTTLGYQSQKPQNLTAVTTGGTPQLSASYQASANAYLPSSSQDANTQTTTYGYNGSSDLTSETTPTNDGNTPDAPKTTYQYDSNGRIQSSVSPNGNAVGCGPTSPQPSCLPYTTSYAYYPSGSGNNTGLLESVTNPVGDKTTYSYDSLGRKVSEVDPNANVSGANPTTYTYDGNDRLLSITDPLGHTTTYTYDGDGNQISVTDGNGHTTTSTYNALNELTKTTKPDPDGSGPLTAPVTTYAYDAAGNKTSETDPNNHTTTYAYDADDRMVSETDPLGNKTTYTYDGDGNLLTTVDPRGNVAGCNCAAQYTTTNTYDNLGRLLSTTDPLGNETTYTYDGDGNQLTTVDPRGNASGATKADHTTTNVYYPSGLLEQVTAPDGGLTKYTYDADGNMLTRTDANNHTTTYTYDHADELTSVTTPLGNETTYTYDANGNKSTMVDANGNASSNPAAHTTTYGYDAANRLTSISYGDGSTPNVSYTYDSVGNRTSMSDGAGTVNYSYDNDNQLLSSTRGSDTFSYTYDPAGNISSRSYPGGTSATYGYNADEQLSTVTSGGQTTSYSYNPASELTQTSLPNGYTETRTYDAAGQVAEVNNARNGTVLSDFAYTLDPDGNPTKVVQTGAVSSTTTYQYDNNNRLIEACYQLTCNEGTGSNDPYIHYTYDPVGNRLSEARPTGTTSYTYNADNQLTLAGSTTYTYDHNGNETSNGIRTFSYDLANRVVSTTSGSTITNYTYDGDGNRLSATTGGTTTKYLWDANNAVPQLALERDGSNNVLRSYIYGIRRIAMNSGGNAYYYLYSTLGSVVNLTSSSGGTEWTYSYEPFGGSRAQIQNDPNAPANPMQFDGEYMDPSSGLYDLRARQYDSSNGRFLNTDPLARTTGTAESPYSYASDAPSTRTDPSGMVESAGDGGGGFPQCGNECRIPGRQSVRFLKQYVIIQYDGLQALGYLGGFLVVSPKDGWFDIVAGVATVYGWPPSEAKINAKANVSCALFVFFCNNPPQPVIVGRYSVGAPGALLTGLLGYAFKNTDVDFDIDLDFEHPVNKIFADGTIAKFKRACDASGCTAELSGA